MRGFKNHSMHPNAGGFNSLIVFQRQDETSKMLGRSVVSILLLSTFIKHQDAEH